MEEALLHRLANLCKMYYTLATIDQLFMAAGAKANWRVEQTVVETTSERVHRFYSWVEGIREHAPEERVGIVARVGEAIRLDTDLPPADRETIAQAVATLERAQRGIKLDPLLSTLVRMLARNGLTREVAIVTYAQPRLEWIDNDRMTGLDVYRLYLSIPFRLFAQIENDREACGRTIYDHIRSLLVAADTEDIGQVVIAPLLEEDHKWRKKALAWLTGEGITNQGRVRSDNIAPRTADGLLFRSKPEIHLYNALKAAGVSFAPLPVFIRGGEQYRRIEPDFVILKDGVVLIVEVDGDTFHRETPSEAHNRTTMLSYEGAYIERVNAEECDTPAKAVECAGRILATISKLKAARR